VAWLQAEIGKEKLREMLAIMMKRLLFIRGILYASRGNIKRLLWLKATDWAALSRTAQKVN